MVKVVVAQVVAEFLSGLVVVVIVVVTHIVDGFVFGLVVMVVHVSAGLVVVVHVAVGLVLVVVGCFASRLDGAVDSEDP